MPKKSKDAIIKRVLSPGVPANGKKPKRRGTVVPQGFPIPPEGYQSVKRKLTRQQWREEYGRALRADPGFTKAMQRLPPRHAALLVAWATNGNNIEAAAEALNYSVATAKTIEKTEGFQEAQRFVDAFIPSEARQWLDILPEARFTLRDLMKSSDDKVRYLAAKDIVDRSEGKSITRIDMSIRDETPSMTDEEMQLAFSIMQQASLGFADTLTWMRANPQQVKDWIKANAKPLLKEGAVEAEFEIMEQPAPVIGYVTDWCPRMEEA